MKNQSRPVALSISLALAMIPSVSVLAAPEASGDVVVTAKERCGRLPPGDAPVDPPEVESTFPSQGATVPPGVLILRITFDQPMLCGWSLIDLAGNWPDCSPL